MTSSDSHMPKTTRSGTGPAPTTTRGRGTQNAARRTSCNRESILIGSGITTIANTGSGTNTGPARWCPSLHCTTGTSLITDTTRIRTNIGNIPHRIRTGITATPDPRMCPGNEPTALAVRLPRMRSLLGGIPRPPTRRQPKILPKTGPHRSNLTESLAGGTPYAGRGRTGAPALPRGGAAPAAQPHPPPPGPKGQDPSEGSCPRRAGPCCPSKANAPLALFSKRTVGGSGRVPLFQGWANFSVQGPYSKIHNFIGPHSILTKIIDI